MSIERNLTRGSTGAGILFGVVLGTLVTLHITMRTPSVPRELTRQEAQSTGVALENEIILDVDNDGTADLIVERGTDNWIRFYKPGFERKTGYNVIPCYSFPMSSNLESVATSLLKDYSELRYQEAKTRFDARKNFNSTTPLSK
jgi:hypothetical protein